ncbi:hypothetical protein S225a_23110 [Candidatus Brocadiaceae bacterium S225]|nr:hypothetical protein S225a_23110 [Candidatus Brocadiaceae bacterium S225]
MKCSEEGEDKTGYRPINLTIAATEKNRIRQIMLDMACGPG